MITNKIFLFVIIFIHRVLGWKFELMLSFIHVVSISIQHDILFNLTFLSLIDDLYELFFAHKIITLGEPYN